MSEVPLLSGVREGCAPVEGFRRVRCADLPGFPGNAGRSAQRTLRKGFMIGLGRGRALLEEMATAMFRRTAG